MNGSEDQSIGSVSGKGGKSARLRATKPHAFLLPDFFVRFLAGKGLEMRKFIGLRGHFTGALVEDWPMSVTGDRLANSMTRGVVFSGSRE